MHGGVSGERRFRRPVPAVNAAEPGAGVDRGEVMRRMGHSTISMALDRYTQALRGSEADTASKLQAFIERSRGLVAGLVGLVVG
jgi:hypothetical protein